MPDDKSKELITNQPTPKPGEEVLRPDNVSSITTRKHRNMNVGPRGISRRGR